MDMIYNYTSTSRMSWSRCIFETRYLRDGRIDLHKSGCIVILCGFFLTSAIFIPFPNEIRENILLIKIFWHISYDFYINWVEFRAFTLD